MARIDDMKAELTAVRLEIAAASQAASVADDGRSLARQRYDLLIRREGQLAAAIRAHYSGSRLRRRDVSFR